MIFFEKFRKSMFFTIKKEKLFEGGIFLDKKFLIMETWFYLCKHFFKQTSVPTMTKFRTIFLEDVIEFFDELDEKARNKIIFNIDKAEQTNDPRLFKKLTNEIWEFRTQYNSLQYRLLGFWDKRDNQDTLVVCSHGIVKKTDKVPSKEIEKSEKIRKNYFDNQ